MAAILFALAPLNSANAGGTIKIGEEGSINIGLGARASYTSFENSAPDGGRSSDFSLDSVRLYVNASLNKTIGATFNTERDSDGDIKLLDGYARLEFSDGLNVWAGRMLPPSDRSNLDGPYYLSSWTYPGLVSQYPAKFAGRDDGVTVWGKLLDKKLTYAVGAFNGHNRISGASNQGDKPLFAGRIAYNFLEVEDNPAYYTSSTYYGAADVFTVGFAIQSQADAIGTAAVRGDYLAWNVDVLFEKKIMGGGAVTLEGAYYDYDTDGVVDVAPSFAGAGPTDNVGGITEGHAWLASAGFLFPYEVGIGKFQPVVRYQEFKATIPDLKTKQYDATLNYVIKGHSARLSAAYSRIDYPGAPNDDRLYAGIQVQF